MRKLAALLIFMLMTTLACTVAAEPVSIAVVYPDTVNDKGWCQSMDSGVKKAIEMGHVIDYTPFESVPVADIPHVLGQLADKYDVILVHGAQFTAAAAETAAEYPDQVFVLGTSDQILGENIFTYMPMSEEPGYVNGVIAALSTQSGKVGIVGSVDSGDAARYVRGFVKGLKDTKADVQYMLSWTGSFSDNIDAGAIGKTFIESGCDVLVGSSQQAVSALRNAVEAEGVVWIGQTTSQLTDFPSVVCAAADYDYSTVIIELLRYISAGSKGGENIPLSYNNGGFVYTFSENAALLPENVKAAAKAALDSMTAGADTIDFSGVMLK